MYVRRDTVDYEAYESLFQLYGLWETFLSSFLLSLFVCRTSRVSLAAQTGGIIPHDSFDSCAAPEGESCLYESCAGIELSVPCEVMARGANPWGNYFTLAPSLELDLLGEVSREHDSLWLFRDRLKIVWLCLSQLSAGIAVQQLTVPWR